MCVAIGVTPLARWRTAGWRHPERVQDVEQAG